MNLEGIVNTEKTERYFWKVCGSVGLGAMVLVALYAFRLRIGTGLRRRRIEDLGV